MARHTHSCQPACILSCLHATQTQRQTTIAARFIRKIQSSDKMATTTGADIHVIRVRLFVSFCCRRFSDSFASFSNLNSALFSIFALFFLLNHQKVNRRIGESHSKMSALQKKTENGERNEKSEQN